MFLCVVNSIFSIICNGLSADENWNLSWGKLLPWTYLKVGVYITASFCRVTYVHWFCYYMFMRARAVSGAWIALESWQLNILMVACDSRVIEMETMFVHKINFVTKEDFFPLQYRFLRLYSWSLNKATKCPGQWQHTEAISSSHHAVGLIVQWQLVFFHPPCSVPGAAALIAPP